MRRAFIILTCGLLLGACAPRSHGTWRASHPNGDRPALAIELTRDGKYFHGAMFLLDPNQPQNFASGQRFPMVIKSADDREIIYSVEFLAHEPDRLVLRLDKPADGPSFRALLVPLDGRSSPIEFNFERVNNS